MIFSRLAVAAFTCAFAAHTLDAAARARPTRPAAPADYKGAIVMDAGTGNILFEDEADTISPPASMTKLMTFAVVYDCLVRATLRLDTMVDIAPEDARMGGTQVYLDPRETFSVEELVYAMMIQSANDAAHALARASAGSVDAFVGLMNAKARELGMTNTTFRTPHGLPPSNRKIADGDLTTPRDFARLSRYLVRNTNVLKYTAIRNRPFGEGSRPEAIAMTNHNKLIDKVAGVDGLKTGFTNGAGFCLAATAERDGRRVIVVTMGSRQAKARDLKVTELLERGFAALPAVARTSPIITPAPLIVPAGPSAMARPAPPRVEPVIKFSIPATTR